MRITFFLIVFLASISVNAYSQEPNWYSKIKQLRLLSSSKQDVIRVFDLESKLAVDTDYYQRITWAIDLQGGAMLAFFFRDSIPCSNGNRLGPRPWDVAEGTLTEMFLWPGKAGIPLDQLPFSIVGFESNEGSRSQPYFISRDQGISIGSDETKRARVIYFVPPASMDFMRCASLPEN